MSSLNDFEISGTTLVSYRGKDIDVVIPDAITSIGENAFRGVYSLNSLIIPASVNHIACRMVG